MKMKIISIEIISFTDLGTIHMLATQERKVNLQTSCQETQTPWKKHTKTSQKPKQPVPKMSRQSM